MASLLNMSGRGLLEKLPYDAEIEYLESTGTQWIDTGVHPYTETSLDIVYEWTYLYPATYTGTYTGFGTFSVDTITGGFRMTGVSGRQTVCFGSGENDTIKQALNTLYHLTLSKRGYTLNQSSESWNKTLARHNGTFALFGCIDYNRTVSRQSKMKVYACKLFEDGMTIRDLIPVRIGTTGYLYDKVSGQLFGNSGTGNFILGPDKTN